jgi:hypothetical protein
MGSTPHERGTNPGPFLVPSGALPRPNRPIRKERIVICGSQEKGPTPLMFVFAGETKIQSEIWQAVQRGDAIRWYVEREGLESMALSAGRDEEYYLRYVDQRLRDLLADAEKARQLRNVARTMPRVEMELVWVGSKHDLIADLNGRPIGAVQTLSIFSHGTPDTVSLRYRPGLLSGLDLTIDDFKAMRPAIFATDGHIYIGSCNIGAAAYGGLQPPQVTFEPSAMAASIAEALDVPVYAWTGRTSYADVFSAGREDASQIVTVGRGRHGVTVDVKELMNRIANASLKEPAVRKFEPKTK